MRADRARRPSGRGTRRRRPTGGSGSGTVTLIVQAVGLGLALAALSLVLERPARSLWRASTEDAPTTEARERSVYYSGCDEARRAGAAPIYRGEPGYREGMDGDGDGIACEPYRGR